MITPPYLKPNSKVAIVCMAGKITLDTVLPAIAILESWGLQVVVGDTVGAIDGVFGGNDEFRKNDFQKQLNDPEIAAIFSARGGYGSTRFIDEINWVKFRKNPKWIVGFSDITAVLTKVNNIGFEAIHGPMPKMFGNLGGEFSLNQLKSMLFGQPIIYQANFNNNNKLGIANAPIVGGNLCILAHTVGSKTEIDTKGKILFIEDISEYYYNIDRMIVQLKRAGKLKHLKGLIVGHFTDCKDSDNPFDKTIEEIITDHTKEFDFPISFGIPIGHENENWPIICGRTAELKVTRELVSINFL
jgi:muramoyltetrapeptide carboxypeptidase